MVEDVIHRVVEVYKLDKRMAQQMRLLDLLTISLYSINMGLAEYLS